ncbi:FecR domain-containing protein [Gemmatimonadota bacterium]
MRNTAIGILLTGILSTAVHAQNQNIAIVYRLMLDQQLMLTPESGQTRGGAMGDVLNHGDALYTSDNTRAAIRFTDDGSIMRMNGGCELQIRAEGERTAMRKTLTVEFGELWARINRRENAEYRIETPTAVAAVKGTEFYVRVDSDGATTIITIDGVLDFFNDVGTVEIPAGFTGTISDAAVAPEVTQTDPEEVTTFRALGTEEDVTEEEEEMIEIEIPFMDEDGNMKTMVITVPKSQVAQLIPPDLN